MFFIICVFINLQKEELNKLDIKKIGFYLSDKEVIEKKDKITDAHFD